MTSLTIDSLVKEFGRVRAVDNVSLEVAEGEMLVLVGPSGCGKTTCLRCVAGLERPTGGEIRIGNRRVSAPSSGLFLPPEQREIGMVFQSYAIWPHMTVFANVAYPLRAMGIARPDVSARVDKALKLVQLDHLAERYSSQLSGGQQQRVALARSLVAEPKLLLFDEPLSNLDAGLRLQMRLEIKELQNRLGFTAVYVTHDQAEAMAIADRIAVLSGGVLQQIGTPRDIYDRPANSFVAGFMGTTNLLSGKVIGAGGYGTAVELDGGLHLHAARSEGVTTGQIVQVSIRPEALTLAFANQPPGEYNCWPARIVRATFVGEQILYRAEAGPLGFEIHARPSEDFPVGTAVVVTADPKSCVVLKA